MDSPKKKNVLEKFATTLLECTLKVDVKIGKTYKVEVTDNGFTVRKRRQKSEDGMHFHYENVESYQANKDGNQLVLQIAPTSLGSGGGLFRFKTNEAAKIVALASRLSVVAAVRKEALLARTASGSSLPGSPKSPRRLSSQGAPFTPPQRLGSMATGSDVLSPLHGSLAAQSSLPSSPDSASSRNTASTTGGVPLDPKHTSLATPKKSTSPSWTRTPPPYVAATSISGATPPQRGDSFTRTKSGDPSKEALAEALEKELRKSDHRAGAEASYVRKRSSDNLLLRDGGNCSRAPSNPPSRSNSKASSPKLPRQLSRGGDVIESPSRVSDGESISCATEEGFRVSARSSDDGFRISSRLSQSGSPNLSRQSSAKGAYSRQSSLGSASGKGEAPEEGGIRLLPRVSSGTNPFLTDSFGQDSTPSSRQSSSLPPPPTSPKKGVFEGFEQFVKVATPRASSEGSRRSSDVTSDVSRRFSSVRPVDLLDSGGESCAPPIVIEITPTGKGADFTTSGGSTWQGLDAEFAPGTWTLPEAGTEWLDVSPPSSPPLRRPEGTGPNVLPGIEVLGSSPSRPVPTPFETNPGSQNPQGTANPSLASSFGSDSLTQDATLHSPPNGGFQGSSPPAVSPAGNPFRTQYPDPFLAAFGADYAPSPEPVLSSGARLAKSKSLNPFAESSGMDRPKTSLFEGSPNPFVSNLLDQVGTRQSPGHSTVPGMRQTQLSSQNGFLRRSQTQPAPSRDPVWETFETAASQRS